MRLRELLALGEIEAVEGDIEREVAGLAYDSRQVGAEYVFFAIRGEKTDGHDFLQQATGRGAVALVVAQPVPRPDGTVLIRVRDVRHALGCWSAHFCGAPSRRLKLVGITGTNGKTTCSYLVESIAAAAGLVPGVIGTINYRYQGHEVPSHHTTPESLDLEMLMAEMLQGGAKAVVLEVSSHALAQERVRGLEFDAALFTNLSRDHLDYHVDMDDYFAAKSKLFTDHLASSAKPERSAVIYGADPRGAELIEAIRAKRIDIWSYGDSGRDRRGLCVGAAVRCDRRRHRAPKDSSRPVGESRKPTGCFSAGGLCPYAGRAGKSSHRGAAADARQSLRGVWLRWRSGPRQATGHGRDFRAAERYRDRDLR